ncbi:hypothetical protein RRG08_055033 [Elysia crispata]|uniref:Uncharacterized protein n=1 Tax=Elysia crispata TaxID=231223 RepID=A0AAE0XRY1_9GAST|nr:hypothetical protein RRG08_055033 [Elysia crispata]
MGEGRWKDVGKIKELRKKKRRITEKDGERITDNDKQKTEEIREAEGREKRKQDRSLSWFYHGFSVSVLMSSGRSLSGVSLGFPENSTNLRITQAGQSGQNSWPWTVRGQEDHAWTALSFSNHLKNFKTRTNSTPPAEFEPWLTVYEESKAVEAASPAHSDVLNSIKSQNKPAQHETTNQLQHGSNRGRFQQFMKISKLRDTSSAISTLLLTSKGASEI